MGGVRTQVKKKGGGCVGSQFIPPPTNLFSFLFLIPEGVSGAGGGVGRGWFPDAKKIISKERTCKPISAAGCRRKDIYCTIYYTMGSFTEAL